MKASAAPVARVVSFHYTLTNEEGEVLDSSTGQDPLTFLEGSHSIIPGLENSMKLLSAGDKRQIKVESAQAYGPQDPEKIIKVGRDKIPDSEEIAIGDFFRAMAGDSEEPVMFRVIGFEGDEVTLDANHPLAGQNLTFDVELVSARDATEEELTHGHVHGAGGHHH